VIDHAIARADPERDGTGVLALITESASAGIQYLAPATGAVLPGGFAFNVLTGGVTLDAV